MTNVAKQAPTGDDQMLGNFTVRYRHHRLYDTNNLILGARGGSTICELLFDGQIVATGVARCHPRDNYNKKIGRAISFGRAMKSVRS